MSEGKGIWRKINTFTGRTARKTPQMLIQNGKIIQKPKEMKQAYDKVQEINENYQTI